MCEYICAWTRIFFDGKLNVRPNSRIYAQLQSWKFVQVETHVSLQTRVTSASLRTSGRIFFELRISDNRSSQTEISFGISSKARWKLRFWCNDVGCTSLLQRKEKPINQSQLMPNVLSCQSFHSFDRVNWYFIIWIQVK